LIFSLFGSTLLVSESVGTTAALLLSNWGSLQYKRWNYRHCTL
jgi:hypothetical protein